MFESLRIHVAFDRGLVRGQRRADQAARVQDAVGRQAARLDRLDYGATAFRGPGIRGDTVSNVTKAAKLETGAVVQVPLFVNVGDRIKVDPREKRYISRA